MSTKIFNIVIKLAKEGGADKDTVKGLLGIKNAMTSGMAVAGAMVGAYYAIDKALDATVGKFVALTGEVEQFRNQTGMSAEDSSRLLEVMKDLEISAEGVGTAFKFAEKNGFEPNLQSLEAMQAQYQALNPGMERTQFLMKEFGKSGLSLQKFFETGDIAQRLEEVNQAMIISDESIQSVQKYKDTADELRDTWEGMKLHAGQLTLPIIISVIETATKGLTIGKTISEFKELNRQILVGSVDWTDYNQKVREYINLHPEAARALLVAEITQEDYAHEKLNGQLDIESNKLDAVHARAYVQIRDLELTEEELAKLTAALVEQTRWETMYTGAKTAAERITASLDLLGQNIQGLGQEGAMVWQGYLAATGKISPAAAVQFTNMMNMYLTVKKMLEAGIAIPIIVNWIQTGTGIGGLGGGPNPTWTNPNPVPEDPNKYWLYRSAEYPGHPGMHYWNSKTGAYKALGGIFSENMARVGERGEEWLVRTPGGGVVVLPNDMVRRLQAWGFAPRRGFMVGGDTGGAGIGTRLPPGAYNPLSDTRDPQHYNTLPGQYPGDIYNPASWSSAGLSTSGGAAVVSQVAAAAAVEAVSPVVTDAMQGFQAAQQVSTQANTNQVALQTRTIEQSGTTQVARLDSILNAIEGLAEALAVEIQKRR